MALKKDERQYKIKTLGSNVPYVPAKSYASIAVDAFKPTLQRLQNDAANTAQANYFQNFQIQTRDQFDKFRNEFENDPDGMRNAVDAYSKTLLEKTPAPYKIQANAMLAIFTKPSVFLMAVAARVWARSGSKRILCPIFPVIQRQAEMLDRFLRPPLDRRLFCRSAGPIV